MDTVKYVLLFILVIALLVAGFLGWQYLRHTTNKSNQNLTSQNSTTNISSPETPTGSFEVADLIPNSKLSITSNILLQKVTSYLGIFDKNGVYLETSNFTVNKLRITVTDIDSPYLKTQYPGDNGKIFAKAGTKLEGNVLNTTIFFDATSLSDMKDISVSIWITRILLFELANSSSKNKNLVINSRESLVDSIIDQNQLNNPDHQIFNFTR